jgi:hypothetical protein
MKIFDKKKDYYDYLVGIYGEDPKIILDRRQSFIPNPYERSKVILYICGKKLEGFYDGKKYYFGENLKEMGKLVDNESEASFYYRLKNEKFKPYVQIEDCEYSYIGRHHRTTESFVIEIQEDDSGINKKYDCPIIFKGIRDNYLEFPVLSEMNVASVIRPEEMFQMISNWLSMRITENENIVDTRDDKLKLQSKGFSNKCSFRPKYNCK